MRIKPRYFNGIPARFRPVGAIYLVHYITIVSRRQQILRGRAEIVKIYGDGPEVFAPVHKKRTRLAQTALLPP